MKFLPILLYLLILLREVSRTTCAYVEANYLSKNSIIAIVLMTLAIGINLYYVIESEL